MAAAIEQKALASDTVSRVHADYTQTPTRQHLRLDERTDLTIEEAEKLARGRPFELIDGRLVFKYPEVLTQRESASRLTIADAEASAQGSSFELVDGRVTCKMGDRKHSRCQAVLTAKLFNYFEQNPIGQVLPEFSVRLWPDNKQNLRTPDVAVFLNKNLHAEEKYEIRAPDLAIEIASDDDTVAEVFANARLYLETGSRVVWLIFPTEKRAMVLTPAEWRWESVELACPELLPEFKLAVAALFQ